MWIKTLKRPLFVRPLQHALAAMLTAAVGLSFAPMCYAQSTAALPMLGDGGDMTSSAERSVGDHIAYSFYRDPDYLDDPVLDDYIWSIWRPLLQSSRTRGDLTADLDDHFAWQVLLVRNRTVNAFALPGGYMGVHLGLLAVVSDRDELASVLAHELSHITQRHIARMFAKSGQQTPWLVGAMILGAIAASQNADAGNALIMGSQALSVQNQLNFSRDMEREADRLGLGVMRDAGFVAQGFVTMFDKLQQASRLNDSGAYPYLRSHPLTAERIADMQARIPLPSTSGATGTGLPPLASAPAAPATSADMVHAMMSARSRTLVNTASDALQTWLTQANDSSLSAQPVAVQAGVLYGAAMAAGRLRNMAHARLYVQRLRTQVAAHPAALQQARWLDLELTLDARDRPPAALRTMMTEAGLDPTQASGTPPVRTELMLQAQLALQINADTLTAWAAGRLQSWVVDHPKDATAWQWLSSLYTAQGQDLRALRASAETCVARLDYTAALDRLKAAQQRARLPRPGGVTAKTDYIEASIIDARYRQITQLVKEQAPAP